MERGAPQLDRTATTAVEQAPGSGFKVAECLRCRRPTRMLAEITVARWRVLARGRSGRGIVTHRGRASARPRRPTTSPTTTTRPARRPPSTTTTTTVPSSVPPPPAVRRCRSTTGCKLLAQTRPGEPRSPPRASAALPRRSGAGRRRVAEAVGRAADALRHGCVAQIRRTQHDLDVAHENAAGRPAVEAYMDCGQRPARSRDRGAHEREQRARRRPHDAPHRVVRRSAGRRS